MMRRRWPFIVGALVAVGALIGCDSAEEAPESVASPNVYLYQTSPGTEPAIRMGWASNIPDPSLVVAWLVYRAEFYGFPAETSYLIDVRGQHSLSDYSDARSGTGTAAVDYTTDFTYLRNGQQEDGSIEATYTRPDLLAGHTYYYRARRVVKPNSGAPPGSTTQTSDLTVDPVDALSQPSDAQGPVTYITSPTLSSPSQGVQSVDPTDVSFVWSTVSGADEYQIRVYTNASATGNPVLISPVLNFTGSTGRYSYQPSGRGQLDETTTYYWVVGARKSSEAYPRCGSEDGWVKSQIRSFETATLPPGTP